MGQVFRRLLLTEAGGSNTNLAVDGSVTPVLFDISSTSFRSFNITSLDFFIEANGRIKSYDDFMTISGLTNGIQIDFTLVEEIYSSEIIKTNADLLSAYWNHSNEFQAPITNKVHIKAISEFPINSLILKENGTIETTISDDISDISIIEVAIGGIIIE